MTDDELRLAYEAARTRRRTAPQQPPVPLERMQELADRAMPAEERESVIEQALLSGGADELALLQSVAAASPPTATWRRYWPLAAAAVLVVAVSVPTLRSLRTGDDVTRFRGATAVAGTPVLRAPQADANNGTAFGWSAVRDADRYVLEVLDGNGEVLIHRETRDTLARVATDSLRVAGRVADGWWVVAKLRDGTERRSALMRLSGGAHK